MRSKNSRIRNWQSWRFYSSASLFVVQWKVCSTLSKESCLTPILLTLEFLPMDHIVYLPSPPYQRLLHSWIYSLLWGIYIDKMNWLRSQIRIQLLSRWDQLAIQLWEWKWKLCRCTFWLHSLLSSTTLMFFFIFVLKSSVYRRTLNL